MLRIVSLIFVLCIMLTGCAFAQGDESLQIKSQARKAKK